MSIPITLITIYNLFVLFRRRVFTSARSRFLIYLGAVLPVGDYVTRLTFGEVWFQTNGFIFHSFFYQGLFWGVAAILHLSYFHDIKRGLQTLFPLLGLLIYFGLTIFSSESVLFFRPFSDFRIQMNLMSNGYVIPLIISIIFLISRKWSDVSTSFASKVSIGILIGLIVYSGIVRLQVERLIAGKIDLSRVVSLTAVNQAKTLWYVVSQNGSEYHGSEYHIFQGWQEDTRVRQLYEDVDEAQVALLDPAVKRVYLNDFRNPVIQVDSETEYSEVNITEFVPLREIFWVKKASLRRNKSGQIISFDIDYGSFI